MLRGSLDKSSPNEGLPCRKFPASLTRAGELAIDLFRDLFDGIGRDYPLVRQKAGQQHAIAEQVDAPGNPCARGEDRLPSHGNYILSLSVAKRSAEHSAEATARP